MLKIETQNKKVFYLVVFLLFLEQTAVILVAQTLGVSVDALLGLLNNSASSASKFFISLSVCVALTLLYILAKTLNNYYTNSLIIQRINQLFYNYLKDLEKVTSYKRTTDYTDKTLFSLYQNTISIFAEQNTSGILNLISSIFFLLLALTTLTYNHWSILMITFITIFLSLLFSTFLGLLYKGKFESLHLFSQKFTKTLSATLRHFLILHYNNRKHKFRSIIAAPSQEQILSETRIATTQFLVLFLMTLVKTILEIGSILIILLMIYHQTFGTTITIGTAIVVWQLLPQVLGQIATIGNTTQSLRAIAPLKIQCTLPAQTKDTTTLSSPLLPPLPVIKSIAIEQLSFNFDERYILFKNLNLNFEGGKVYGISGASGCGKSTFAKILLGIYRNYVGSVKINNLEVKNLSEKFLRQTVTYCGPDLFVFDDSLKNNITLFEKNIDDSKVKQIVKIEHLESAKNALSLSAGQKQRVILARCILANTPLLIFDESFANLDAHTLKQIKIQLKKWKQDKTLIIISHHIKENDDFFDKVVNLDK